MTDWRGAANWLPFVGRSSSSGRAVRASLRLLDDGELDAPDAPET
jgi:hypothetical protein